MKYLVIDERVNGTGDVFTDVFDDIETANREAERSWDHLTAFEQKKRHIYVGMVLKEDLNEWAINEEDGEIDWSDYHSMHNVDGGFDSAKS